MKKALLWCLLALVVASCGGDDEPTPEPLPVVSAEIVFVPCVSKSELALDLKITSDKPVSVECDAGRDAQNNVIFCRGLPESINGEWTGRIYCPTGTPDPRTSANSNVDCEVRDAGSGQLGNSIGFSPGLAPQEQDPQIYSNLCGL